LAMYKNIMTPTGKCEFWIVGAFWLDNFSKNGYVTIYGFENREHCDFEGSVFKHKISYSINNQDGDFDKYFNKNLLEKNGVSPYRQFYKYIKDKDENFNDAEDWIYK